MSDDFSDIEIIDDSALLALDAIETAYVTGSALPPRTVVSKPGLVQRDLFGAPIAPAPPKPQPVAGPSRTNSANAPVGGETRAKVRLSKTWDPATFARHGWSKKNAAAEKARAKGKSGKGKQKAYASDEEPWDDEDEEVLDEDSDEGGDDEFLIDTSYDPNAPILPIKWPPDERAAQTFVYPVQADKPLRSYQLNIIQRALFDNTLVSLPTGLGKTFIAAVVMLNFYRWYPKGKVLFLAPTRPLVTQQIKACHYIAGIPQADCIELTGGTMPKLRSVGWLTKRVVYSTPQTVERDLAKGRLDPRDVVCVVVDEAHRASGDYSYCGVIRYMMSRNPHFRVLALTATPGARGEAVQEVIDNLHIGRIEVRAEDSIDIRQYIHKKSFDLRVLPLGPHLSALRDKWIALMKPFHGPLLAAKLVYQKDPALLSPYGVQQAYQKINSLPGGRQANGKYFPMIKTLAAMARAIEYLTVQSVTSFESVVKDLQQSGSKSLTQQPAFRDILRETSALRAHPAYVGHPKMEMLRSICVEHFKSSLNLVDEYGDKRETRVMIFCNFRAVVEEIVACLNTQKPLIKATAFVGQASSKGVKGKSQKEQLETIRRFKKGHYNVLVATSIGEEGLDIGEIDLIICYESNKSPIRMLQRVGRTGRARDGHITVLMTEGREEKSWDQANDAYNDVQNALTSNKIFDLYVDGERLLPDHIKPKCEQVEIKAQPLDLEKMTMNGHSRLERKALNETKKEKRKVDIRANAPDDAFLGFRTAGQVAAAKKAKPPAPSQVVRDRKSAALLTLDQETELRSRWQCDSTGRSIRPQRFDDIEDLPFARDMAGGAHRIPRHSSRFDDLIASLRAVEALSDGKTKALDDWHDKHSKAFEPKLVQVFKAEDRLGPPLRHRRLKRYPSKVVDEEVPPSFPFATNVASTGMALAPSPPGPSHQPLFRTSSKAEADPLADELFGDLAAKKSPPVASPSSPPPRRVSSSPVHVITSPQSPLQVAKPPSRPPSRTSSTVKGAPGEAVRDDGLGNYSIDLDDGFDVDLIMSDSELLQGAVVRRPSESMSPPPQQESAPQKQVSDKAEIVLEDSDEDVVEVLSRSPKQQQQRQIAQPAVPALAAAASKPALPPPPAAPQKAPAKANGSVNATATTAGAIEEDEFSVLDLDLADEDFEACIAEAQKLAAAAAERHRSLSPGENSGDDRPNSMPPPPPPAPARSATSAMAFRPAGSSLARTGAAAIVVASSSSPVRQAGPARAVANPATSSSSRAGADATGNASTSTAPIAPMRRLAVPDSSEASSPVVGGLVARRGVAPSGPLQETQPGSGPIIMQPAGRIVLNRLKRGKDRLREEEEEEVVVHDSDEEMAGSGGPLEGSEADRPAKKRRLPNDTTDGNQHQHQKKKRKKLLLTHKQASKFGIFDIEAVNSSASGSEASSEGYSSENSIDRSFIAHHPSPSDDEDASAQAQFYRDSLATQAPLVFGNRRGLGAAAPTWIDKVGKARRPIPLTPGGSEDTGAGAGGGGGVEGDGAGEMEDWSYDSFVVRDDEEIVYDSESSPVAVERRQKRRAARGGGDGSKKKGKGKEKA
ncbi:hypothetical protein JCM10908_001809 [Rhodotorula pacifica]|uniref:uncharacterized protein n=1 Tax=Rhodotorula pacifica TaxID=1495444 RepID=UPI00316C1494